MFLANATGQVRWKVSSTRIPPWRRWVKGREHVPTVSFQKNLNIPDYLDMLPRSGANSALQLEGPGALSAHESSMVRVSSVGDLVTRVSDEVPSMRKFLLATSYLRTKCTAELDKVADSLRNSLAIMTIDEQLRTLSAFGQLVDYSVSNRVSDRYNSKTVTYSNERFYKCLVDSIDWSEVYSGTSLSKSTKSLAPFMHVIRSLNRLRGETVVAPALSSAIQDMVSCVCTTPRISHLVELVMICGRNKIIASGLFDMCVSELESNYASFHEDDVGDLARTFTSLGYYSSRFHSVLSRELPVRMHELLWWNLIDLADYFGTVVVPHNPVLSLSDSDTILRFGNEVWKWIPEMRSGYTAKALRVVSELNTADRRTRRALVRAIPKSLDKLHMHVVAESIIAAAKIGYLPRKRYGKKYGSVFYRRLGNKLSSGLVDGAATPLARVGSELVVTVVESLAKIHRPLHEFFETVVEDVRRAPGKYSVDQLVRMQKVMGEKQVLKEEVGKRMKDEGKISVENLAFLGLVDDNALNRLLSAENDANAIAEVSVDTMVRLIDARECMHVHALGGWLDANLAKLSDVEFISFLVGIAQSKFPVQIDQTTLGLLGMRANAVCITTAPESLCVLIATILVLSDYNFAMIDRKLVSAITGKPIHSLDAIHLCQLTAAHARLATNIQMDDSIYKFVTWIETHLVSKLPPTYIPGEVGLVQGGVTDLRVWPVNVPLAVPDPRIDLRAVHSAKSALEIRRVLKPFAGDAGVACFKDPSNKSIQCQMRNAYLKKLGWTVQAAGKTADLQPTEESSILPTAPQALGLARLS